MCWPVLLMSSMSTAFTNLQTPYVVALGVDLRSQGLEVTIVTDDRKDKPGKYSLATTAGLVGLPSIPLFAFLRTEGISPPRI